MPFQTCLQQIISHRLNETDQEYSVMEYIKAYSDQVAELEKSVHYVEKPSKKGKTTDEDDDDDDDDEETEVDEIDDVD